MFSTCGTVIPREWGGGGGGGRGGGEGGGGLYIFCKITGPNDACEMTHVKKKKIFEHIHTNILLKYGSSRYSTYLLSIMKWNYRFIHEISVDFCLITEQTLAGSEGVQCCHLVPGFNFIPRTHQCIFFVPVYNTQTEYNTRYFAGKVWIYRGELQYIEKCHRLVKMLTFIFICKVVVIFTMLLALRRPLLRETTWLIRPLLRETTWLIRPLLRETTWLIRPLLRETTWLIRPLWNIPSNHFPP